MEHRRYIKDKNGLQFKDLQNDLPISHHFNYCGELRLKFPLVVAYEISELLNFHDNMGITDDKTQSKFSPVL